MFLLHVQVARHPHLGQHPHPHPPQDMMTTSVAGRKQRSKEKKLTVVN
jgi:hypothetical protein